MPDFTDGVMVALHPDPEIAKKIALPESHEGALGADTLHVTLAYLGNKGDEGVPDGEDWHELYDVARQVAKRHPPQAAKLTGTAHFAPDPTAAAADAEVQETPFVGVVGSDTIHDLRKDLVNHLKGRGLPVSEKFPFQPHMTLAYLPEGKVGDPLPEVIDLGEFPELVVTYGTKEVRFPFGKVDEEPVWNDSVTAAWQEGRKLAGQFRRAPEEGEVPNVPDDKTLEHLLDQHRDSVKSEEEISESGRDPLEWHEALHSERLDFAQPHWHYPGSFEEMHEPEFVPMGNVSDITYSRAKCNCGWETNIRSDQASMNAWRRHIQKLDEGARRQKAGPPREIDPNAPVPKRHAMAMDEDGSYKQSSWIDQVTAPYQQDAVVEPDEGIDPKVPPLYQGGWGIWPDDQVEEIQQRTIRPTDIFSEPKTGAIAPALAAFFEREAMPRDEDFINSLDFQTRSKPKNMNATNHWVSATHPEKGLVGQIEWANWEHSGHKRAVVKSIWVDPHYQRHGIATELWGRAREVHPHLQHSDTLTEDGRDWVRSLDKAGWKSVGHTPKLASETRKKLQEKTATTRYCTRCGNAFDYSEDGETTGFCGTCREKEGFVNHHSWSEDMQEGHYGSKEESVPLFHAAPRSRRNQIQSSGTIHHEGQRRRWSWTPAGNYAWETKAQAVDFAHGEASDFGEPFDVWEVDPVSEADRDETVGYGGIRTPHPLKVRGLVHEVPANPSRAEKERWEWEVEDEEPPAFTRWGSAEDEKSKGYRAFLGIGIPGSGKSSLLKPYANAIGATYVSSDATREEVTGDEADVSQDDVVWPLIYRKVHEALGHGDVVIDATHSDGAKRRDMIRHVRQKAGEVHGIHFDVPLDLAIERNQDRDRFVPVSVIQAMHQKLEDDPPEEQEGFDSITRITPGKSRDPGGFTVRKSSRSLVKAAWFLANGHCKFCLGSGVNAGQRCWRCASTGGTGQVPCTWCGLKLAPYEAFVDQRTGSAVPACGHCIMAADVDEKAVELMKGQGGFTIHNDSGKEHTGTGFVVSVQGHEEAIPIEEVTPERFEKYRREHADALAGGHWGGWNNSEVDGKVYLDVVAHHPTWQDAKETADRNYQQTFYRIPGTYGENDEGGVEDATVEAETGNPLVGLAKKGAAQKSHFVLLPDDPSEAYEARRRCLEVH